MVRLQLYYLVSGAAVTRLLPQQRCRRGAASEELWSQAGAVSSVHHGDGCISPHHQGLMINWMWPMMKQTCWKHVTDHIQIACRQDEDSRSTRCLLEIKWIKNELSLNPSYFMRFSVILILRLWSKELSMSIKSILHMTDVLNWHGKQSINDMG